MAVSVRTDVSRTHFLVEPGKQEIVITRSFDAPRERVFKAFTDPGLVPHWWGPRTYTTVIDRLDARPGGLWRFIQKDATGSESAFHGVYHEVASPGRLVYTFEYEGMPGHVLLETIVLEEQDGKTKMTDRSVFQCVEDRDGMVASGMESGATESMERLAELLSGLRIGG
jgi:uncharacterized protein YndB with AHSA1/START domain